MVDIHSHILPEIDDGSKNINMTLEMLKMAEKDGTKKIVATPHYCRGYGEAKYLEIIETTKNIKELSKKNNINIDIYYGQEVFFTNDILELYEEGIIGTINNTRYMLVELPMDKFDYGTLDILYELNIKGVTTILAHPERYLPLIKEPEKINEFINEGILFQMNSGSLLGSFGKKVKATSELFLENRIYSFMGSDAHNIGSRPPGIYESIKIIESKDKEYKKKLEERGIEILDNREVKFEGEKIKKRKRFFIFK